MDTNSADEFILKNSIKIKVCVRVTTKSFIYKYTLVEVINFSLRGVMTITNTSKSTTLIIIQLDKYIVVVAPGTLIVTSH